MKHASNNKYEPMKYKWIEMYINYLTDIKGYSSHTCRNYQIDLRALFKFIREEEIKSKKLQEYIAQLYLDGKSKITIARVVSSLRSFFKYLHKQEILNYNPALQLMSPRNTRKIPIILHVNEVKKLINTPNKNNYLGFRDSLIIELLYTSGIRLSELVLLDKKDIYHGRGYIKVLGKGKKERIVPITTRCNQLLQEYLEHKKRWSSCEKHQGEQNRSAVFLNRFGERISSRSIDRMFVQYKRKAGIVKNVTPHILRHSIATHLLEKGMNLRCIQEILGHKTIATTTIYTQVSLKYKKEAYDQYHPLS